MGRNAFWTGGINLLRAMLRLPKEFLPDRCITSDAGSWYDFGCRFLAVVGASGIGKPPLVNAGPHDAPAVAGQIR